MGVGVGGCRWVSVRVCACLCVCVFVCVAFSSACLLKLPICEGLLSCSLLLMHFNSCHHTAHMPCCICLCPVHALRGTHTASSHSAHARLHRYTLKHLTRPCLLLPIPPLRIILGDAIPVAFAPPLDHHMEIQALDPTQLYGMLSGGAALGEMPSTPLFSSTHEALGMPLTPPRPYSDQSYQSGLPLLQQKVGPLP